MDVRRSIMVACLGLTATAVQFSEPLAADSSTDVDTAAIKAVFAGLEAAAESRDAARVASFYLTDADIWVAGHPLVTGREGIKANEEEFYKTPGFQSWRVKSIGDIRFIARDVAMVNAKSVTTLTDRELLGEATLTFVRRAGSWRIAAVRVMHLDSPR